MINFGIIKIIVQWCNGSFHQMSCKIGALENFAKLTGKHLCRSLLFNKVAGLNHLCYRTPPRNCFRRFIYFRDHYGRASRCCLSIPAENIRKPLWLIMMGGPFYQKTEAVVRSCSVKKMFLKISQSLQEYPCTRGSFTITLQASLNSGLFHATGSFLYPLKT